MTDTFSFIKSVGYLLAWPFFLAIPLIIIAKLAHYWLDSSLERKNNTSFGMLLFINIVSILTVSIYKFSAESQQVALFIAMLATHIHFSGKEIRNQGGFKREGLFAQKHEAFDLGFRGAWRSKVHWGLIYIVLGLIYSIVLQIKTG